MSPVSVAMVALFAAWKAGRGIGWRELTAREADAFAAMEEEWQAEVANGK